MTTTENTTVPTETELRELGFTQAAENLKTDRELARKLRIAFEHFRVVEPAHIERFNQELAANTRKVEGKNKWGEIIAYDRLKLTPIQDYKQVPPKEVLDKIREAKALDCFDSFEVATIESVRVVPDPIIFGVIAGSPNRYFVSQWDVDISIEQILRPEEG